MRFKLIIAFSGIQQALINTAYNNRVKECSQAAEILLKAAGKPIGDKRLGQLSTAEYETYNHLLTGPMARRATHFFDEMQRVEQGIEAWKQGDLNLFGQLVTASGHSSIHNYECGSPPLIDLYNILLKTEGIYGARFSGAGFRGCCFALVDPHITLWYWRWSSINLTLHLGGTGLMLTTQFYIIWSYRPKYIYYAGPLRREFGPMNHTAWL